MQYRRARVRGGTYFFTVVTHKRQSIFARKDNVDLLRRAFQYVMWVTPCASMPMLSCPTIFIVSGLHRIVIGIFQRGGVYLRVP